MFFQEVVEKDVVRILAIAQDNSKGFLESRGSYRWWPSRKAAEYCPLVARIEVGPSPLRVLVFGVSDEGVGPLFVFYHRQLAHGYHFFEESLAALPWTGTGSPFWILPAL